MAQNILIHDGNYQDFIGDRHIHRDHNGVDRLLLPPGSLVRYEGRKYGQIPGLPTFASQIPVIPRSQWPAQLPSALRGTPSRTVSATTSNPSLRSTKTGRISAGAMGPLEPWRSAGRSAKAIPLSAWPLNLLPVKRVGSCPTSAEIRWMRSACQR